MRRKSLIPILVLVAAVGVAVIAHYLASVLDHRAAERAECAAVGRMLGASPGQDPRLVRGLMHPRLSGNATLDSAMQHMAAELRGYNPAGANLAISRVRAICDALGLWSTYH